MIFYREFVSLTISVPIHFHDMEKWKYLKLKKNSRMFFYSKIHQQKK